jgi:hypothetical protein
MEIAREMATAREMEMIRIYIGSTRYKREKKNMRLIAAFCLFMRTSPINFGLLAGSGNTL